MVLASKLHSGAAGRSQLYSNKNPSSVLVMKTEHPIISRLPPISQSKIQSMAAVRGKTVLVDAMGNVIQAQSNSTAAASNERQQHYVGANAMHNSEANLDSDSDEDFVGLQDGMKDKDFETSSIWTRVSDKDDTSTKEAPLNQVSSRIDVPGFTVISADPAVVAGVDFGNPTSNGDTEDESSSEENQMLRTGVITGTVSNRISLYSSAPKQPTGGDSESEEDAGRRESDDEDMYEDDFNEEDDDLVAHYRKTLKGEILIPYSYGFYQYNE